MHGGAQNGAKLRFEQLRSGKAQPQRALAEEGVLLLRQREGGKRFIAADVQRAQDDLPVAETVCHSGVSLILRLLVGERFGLHIEKFCAEQPNAVAVFSVLQRRVGARPDVQAGEHARAAA